MTKTSTIALLPLDNRPVSYLLPKQIAEFSGINLVLPKREYLGNLICGSNSTYLEKWLGELNNIDFLIIALDSWVYGGLSQSRKHLEEVKELRKKVEFIKTLHNITKYGFSSIMRIPTYNSNDEDKEYLKEYGEKIFKWSELLYKVGRGIKEKEVSQKELIENWYQSAKAIPAELLSDYKSHRDKNLTINLLWLESLHNHTFEYLLFSLDDSAKYGINVAEAEYLQQQIKTHNFTNLSKVTYGTDEVPLVLLTKTILKNTSKKPTISLYFSSMQGKDEVARYEPNSIYTSVLEQIKTLGLEIKDTNDSDIVLCIHCADSLQGDHIFYKKPKEDTENNANKIKDLLTKINKPFILLDLAYANGADPKLINALTGKDNSKINWQNCYGYSAWNTCSNSTGSALAIGINRWVAEKKKTFNDEAFKKCLLVRFLDDFAYQTKIRHKQVTEHEINDKMKPYVETFSKILGLSSQVAKCALPWKRSFEVEINI